MVDRDLKTTNVFLTKNRKVKLGDFGISKIMTTKLQALTVVGTPYYISPEMVRHFWYNVIYLFFLSSLEEKNVKYLKISIHFFSKIFLQVWRKTVRSKVGYLGIGMYFIRNVNSTTYFWCLKSSSINSHNYKSSWLSSAIFSTLFTFKKLLFSFTRKTLHLYRHATRPTWGN